MPLPNLLIIGAMKAGTTSLYMDVASHSGAFLAQDKEPHSLCSDDVLTPQGRAQYEAVYARATPGQIRCDASTGYSKRPDFEGVPQRAVNVLPEGFKVIYLVRHPIERIISQHHHEHSEGRVGPSIDEEVRRHARYVHYSRYAYQLEPWLDLVGRDRLHVIRFEDYVDSRRTVFADVCRFLGLPLAASAVDEDKVYNKSQGKRVKNRFWHALQHNAAYRKLVRPLAPLRLRLALRRVLLPKAPDRPPPPAPDTLAYLRQALADDVWRLSELLGREAPLWDDFCGDRGTSALAAANRA